MKSSKQSLLEQHKTKTTEEIIEDVNDLKDSDLKYDEWSKKDEELRAKKWVRLEDVLPLLQKKQESIVNWQRKFEAVDQLNLKLNLEKEKLEAENKRLKVQNKRLHKAFNEHFLEIDELREDLQKQ
jgi:uncharacterized pyridoxal phosphate-containing UPF0001 family protein